MSNAIFDPLEDGISSVQLVSHMGDDIMVVNAARVSMHKESAGLEDGTISEADTKLIRYLAKHGHWTPFSQPQLQFRVKMPIFVARQWFKHQIGFTRNEVSRRYVDDTPEMFVPAVWRGRAANVKQGSSDVPVEWLKVNEYTTTPIDDLCRRTYQICVDAYELMIRNDVAPEQARMMLPQGMYTEFIETCSLAAAARMAKLRLDPHAQLEIRNYAKAYSSAIAPLFPVAWKELTENA